MRSKQTYKQTKNCYFIFCIRWVAPVTSRISIFERLPFPRGGWWVFFALLTRKVRKTMSRSHLTKSHSKVYHKYLLLRQRVFFVKIIWFHETNGVTLHIGIKNSILTKSGVIAFCNWALQILITTKRDILDFSNRWVFSHSHIGPNI